MRQLTVKYNGTCRKCGTVLVAGEIAIYERYIGLFCITCAPTDTEEIRAYRQEAGDKRAANYEEWADKRVKKATATLKHNETYTTDYAFNTQPGPIPLRAKVIKQNDKAYESLKIARNMQRKADDLRHVRVAGDAAKRDQEKRDYILSVLKVGHRVDTILCKTGTVVKINKKSALIMLDSTRRELKFDLIYMHPIDGDNSWIGFNQHIESK